MNKETIKKEIRRQVLNNFNSYNYEKAINWLINYSSFSGEKLVLEINLEDHFLKSLNSNQPRDFFYISEIEKHAEIVRKVNISVLCNNNNNYTADDIYMFIEEYIKHKNNDSVMLLLNNLDKMNKKGYLDFIKHNIEENKEITLLFVNDQLGVNLDIEELKDIIQDIEYYQSF